MVTSPEISVNKLAEYIVSKSARQRAILRMRKYPPEEFNVGMFHKEAAESISRYISDGAVDSSPIDTQIAILSQIKSDKVGTMRRVAANIDALERFQSMLDFIDLKGAEPTLGSHKNTSMKIHNVKVSVRPEIILKGKGTKGKAYIGAVKLHFSKTTQMDKEMAGYVSAVMQHYCNCHLKSGDEIVNPDYCQVVDVGSGQVFAGTKSTSQRIKDAEAACQNIVAIWADL